MEDHTKENLKNRRGGRGGGGKGRPVTAPRTTTLKLKERLAKKEFTKGGRSEREAGKQLKRWEGKTEGKKKTRKKTRGLNLDPEREGNRRGMLDLRVA